MQLKKNHSLKKFNTFGIAAKAENFYSVQSESDFLDALKSAIRPLFILGGGSNLLLTKDVKGLVIKNEIKGIKIERQFKHCVHISAGAGENWHELVLWCINKKLGGIENLSLIPGTVGAAPIQNIGAYGVELKEVFVKLEAIEIASGKKKIFWKKDCQFGYRESVFKQKEKGNYFITKVFLRLNKKHNLNISYGAIKNTLKEQGIKKPSIKTISQAVIQIRSSKLPDPAKIGNSGSFFKNPEISKSQFKKLQKQFPNIVFYDLPNGKVKVPAGWLIEQDGWKGKRVGHTGAHKNQALVLVNYGKATGQEILQHAKRIIDSVNKKFGIKLKAEVNVY